MISILMSVALVTQVPHQTLSAPTAVALSCDGTKRGAGARISSTRIVTAAHVAKSSCLVDGLIKAKVVWRNTDLDVAILEHVPISSQPTWNISCRDIIYREPYEALGFPNGGPIAKVKLVGSGLRHDIGHRGFALFTGGDIYHGMSGGPIVDYRGRLVGIVTSIGRDRHAGASFGRMLLDTPLCKEKKND